jgi:uncharacterized protein (DUF58 family)
VVVAGQQHARARRHAERCILVLRLLDLAAHKTTTLPDSTGIAALIRSHDGKRIFAQATNPERILAIDLARQQWDEVFRGAFSTGRYRTTTSTSISIAG